MSTRYAELVHWMSVQDKKYFIPASADIDLTNICNQDCVYCSTADFRKEKPVQLDYKKYIDLVDYLATWRQHHPNSVGTFSTVVFSGGGEPTLLKGYEKVIEHCVDVALLPALITNGSHLHKLIENVSVDKIQRMLYIGIDIDAGSPDLYEKIRRSKPLNGLYDQVVENIFKATQVSSKVDLKVVLCDDNSSLQALQDIFSLAKKTSVRQVYFRPLYNASTHYVFPITEHADLIKKLGQEYNVRVKINATRFLPRNYSRCHQMYLFPVFCPDGKIYACCENKGNPAFAIGEWLDNDFRDSWLQQQHNVYNGTNTHLCHPCRSNNHNIEIQNIINDPESLERLLM
jgi:sulfatase maturation enzyme AslB (radical SAM superfamily)